MSEVTESDRQKARDLLFAGPVPSKWIADHGQESVAAALANARAEGARRQIEFDAQWLERLASDLEAEGEEDSANDADLLKSCAQRLRALLRAAALKAVDA